MNGNKMKTAARDFVQSLSHPRAGDAYRHYKGGLYDVVMVGADEDDPAMIRVGYRSRDYGSDQFRTLANWNETVEFEGRRLPRFELIESYK